MNKEYTVSDTQALEAIIAIIDLTKRRECLWKSTTELTSPPRETEYKGTKFVLSEDSSYLSLSIRDKDKKLSAYEYWKSSSSTGYDLIKALIDQIKMTEKDILEEAPSPVNKFLADYRTSKISTSVLETKAQLPVESQEEFVLNDRQE